ncbi:SIS domain-containing protein [Pseudorhodobacter sp. W20_MBD10_FR17]|uniref:SIS domain-containing protein n=1 Tax=Pseudorhodobacter sp. W20_MBD10_FR17 TaxID=3240266 RepID=UPI003F998604
MKPTGLDLLNAEMSRQFTDARATLADCGPVAQAADHIRAKGRLMLLGMGGSHWANRMVEPIYRAAGIDATAQALSEYMRAPLPGDPALIVTSQSGASGEVLRFLDGQDDSQIIGLTLAPQSRLAQVGLPIIGAGGVELAYAATRSLLITIAMHAAILHRLGLPVEGLEAALATPASLGDLGPAVDALAAARNAVFVARGSLQGVADAAALSLMELARIPVLGLEAGQFRHGPFEMAGADTAVVFLRAQSAEPDNIEGLAAELMAHGVRPIVVDLSGQPAIAGCITLQLPAADGLVAAANGLVGLQAIVVAAAARMVPDVGTPLWSTKVTSGESR